MKQQWQLRSLWPALIPTLFVGILITLATIAQMMVLSRVISNVFIDHQYLAQVMSLLFVLLCIMLLRACLLWGREVLVQRVARSVKSRLRIQLATTLFMRGPAYYDNERTGELVATVYEGIERLDACIGRYLPQLVK